MKEIPQNSKSLSIISLWGCLYIISFTLSILGAFYENFALYLLFKSMFMPLLSLLLFGKWGNQHKNKTYWLLQGAFFFAWLGDILMSFQKWHDIFFALGASMFLIQHTLYISVNIIGKKNQGVIWKKPYFGSPNLVYVILFSITYWLNIDVVLKFESTIYSFFIATAFLTSINRDMKNIKKHLAIIAGFAIFLVSDILIVIDRFAISFGNYAEPLVLLTYFL